MYIKVQNNKIELVFQNSALWAAAAEEPHMWKHSESLQSGSDLITKTQNMNITQEATAKNLAYNKMAHADSNTTAGRARIELGQWTADSTQAYHCLLYTSRCV